MRGRPYFTYRRPATVMGSLSRYQVASRAYVLSVGNAWARGVPRQTESPLKETSISTISIRPFRTMQYRIWATAAGRSGGGGALAGAVGAAGTGAADAGCRAHAVA